MWIVIALQDLFELIFLVANFNSLGRVQMSTYR